MNIHRIIQTMLGGSFFALILSVCSAGEPQSSDVFTSGEAGFKSIRIPSVVVTKQGTVLAAAEGRAVATDQAHNKIVLKRSTDGGKTWGALQVIADDGANSLNNPTAANAAYAKATGDSKATEKARALWYCLQLCEEMKTK